jgi:phosphohistidine phosphatase
VAGKHVLLLRHAKSSWDDPNVGDHDRPLAGRGRKAGAAIARHLADQGQRPDLVLCSPSRRTRETLDLLQPVLGDVATRIEDGLYGASAAEMLALLKELPDDVGRVLVVGHNPGIQQLTLSLARPADGQAAVASKFPTGALASIALDVDRWSDLEPETGELEGFVRPRDLS